MTCDQARSLDWAAYAADPTAAEFSSFRRHYPACVECAREVARLSRLEAILRGQAQQDGHPDPDALWALEHRPESLRAEERQALAAHVEQCAACRSELAALRGFDFARLRAPASSPAAPLRAPRRRRWGRALAIAAGLGLVLTSVLLLRERMAGVGERERVPIARPEPPPAVPAPASPAPSERPLVAAGEGRPPAAAPVPEPQAGEPPATGLQASRSGEAPVPGAPAPAPVAPPRAPAPPTEETPAPAPAPRSTPSFPAEPLVYAHAGASDPALARLRVPTILRGAAGSAPPRILALAPDHVGLTAEAAPTLYWTLAAPTNQRIEIVVTDERSEQPLLDRSLAGAGAGIHAIELARAGVRLEPGVTYRWYASVVPDAEDRTSEVVSGGAIRRVALDPALARRLAESEEGERAHLLAGGGLFYDALEAVSASIARHPGAPEPRRARRALLAAVGLDAPLPGDPPAAP